MFAEARVFEAGDMRVGLEAMFEREVTEQDILGFAHLSGDANPLHVDPAYAAHTNYERRIAHGAFQVGLASAMLGMFLPGRNVLLMSTQARFPNPLYFPSHVRVRGTVISWSEQSYKGVLKVVVETVASDTVTAEVFMGFTFHDRADRRTVDSAPAQSAAARTDAPIVLLTGAAGGLGSEIAVALAPDFHVVALTNRQPLDDRVRATAGVTEMQLPLSAPDWESQLDDWRAGRPVFGVVHAAWPGAPQGGLLGVADDVIDQQLHFGATLTVRLARYIAATAGEQGGRLIAVGSIYGTERPALGLAAYSLGKAVLEHTVRLLAPELARKQITVNAICPSVVATGMNSRINDRQRLREIAQIPMGRLCEPADVSGAVRFLLSPQAAFMSGQSLPLTGGQL